MAKNMLFTRDTSKNTHTQGFKIKNGKYIACSGNKKKSQIIVITTDQRSLKGRNITREKDLSQKKFNSQGRHDFQHEYIS